MFILFFFFSLYPSLSSILSLTSIPTLNSYAIKFHINFNHLSNYRKHLQLSSDAAIFGAISNDGNFGWLPLRLLLPNVVVVVDVAFSMAFGLLLLLANVSALLLTPTLGPIFPQVMLLSCSSTAFLPMCNAFNEPLRKTAVAGVN